MIRFWKYAVSFVLGLCIGCAGKPAEMPFDPVVTSEANTVALVMPDEDSPEQLRPFCSGVWVGADWILTARHCTMGGENDDEPKATVQFTTVATWDSGKPLDGQVIYRDDLHDLALVHTKTSELHTYARLASTSPVQGAAVHVVGHPVGFLWTYLTGQVAGYRPTIEQIETIKGPFLQLEVPTSPGNSGGGAFDSQGWLVGICSFHVGRLEAQGFFIPVESIRPFMAASHVP